MNCLLKTNKRSEILVDLKKLHIENEGGVGRNPTQSVLTAKRLHSRDSTSAITVIRSQGELGSLSKRHRHHTFIPALDNLANTNHKLERFSTSARAIEHLSAGQLRRYMEQKRPTVPV